MNTSKTRVLIADDHEVVRKAYALLAEKAGMEVVKEVGSGSQAVDAALELEPDLVLLDISMPDMDGLAALSIIKYLLPDIKVIILTSHEEEIFMRRAKILGASGFLTKRLPAEEMIATMKAVAGGDPHHEHVTYVEKVTAPSIPEISLDQRAAPPEVDLTDQEAVVLSLLSMGYTNEDLTEELCVSRNTLKTHLGNIYGKLGVSDRTQAAVWALRNGFSPYRA